jgi:hypothetical protein
MTGGALRIAERACFCRRQLQLANVRVAVVAGLARSRWPAIRLARSTRHVAAQWRTVLRHGTRACARSVARGGERRDVRGAAGRSACHRRIRARRLVRHVARAAARRPGSRARGSPAHWRPRHGLAHAVDASDVACLALSVASLVAAHAVRAVARPADSVFSAGFSDVELGLALHRRDVAVRCARALRVHRAVTSARGGVGIACIQTARHFLFCRAGADAVAAGGQRCDAVHAARRAAGLVRVRKDTSGSISAAAKAAARRALPHARWSHCAVRIPRYGRAGAGRRSVACLALPATSLVAADTIRAEAAVAFLPRRALCAVWTKLEEGAVREYLPACADRARCEHATVGEEHAAPTGVFTRHVVGRAKARRFNENFRGLRVAQREAARCEQLARRKERQNEMRSGFRHRGRRRPAVRDRVVDFYDRRWRIRGCVRDAAGD